MNIYWKGKIYEVVTKEPIAVFVTHDDEKYFMAGYNEFLQLFPIPLTGTHSFTDGQEVVEGKDYKRRCDPSYKTCMCRDVEKCEHEVATPINQ